MDYVTVNGKTITNYSTEGTVLTIPYKLRNANNLTVGIYRDRQEKANNRGNTEKTFTIVTYQLAYENNHYKAYKLYTLNDTTGALKTIAAGSKDVSNKVLGLLTKK